MKPTYKRGEYKKAYKKFCLDCNKPIVGNAKKAFCDNACCQRYTRAHKRKNGYKIK